MRGLEPSGWDGEGEADFGDREELIPDMAFIIVYLKVVYMNIYFLVNYIDYYEVRYIFTIKY